MRTTKKILAGILAVCMLASTSAISGFAAETDAQEATNKYVAANENIDSLYTYTKRDLGATYSPNETTFKVWAPTATKVTLNLYATGSDGEEGAADLGNFELSKLYEGDKWTGVWSGTVSGNLKNVYYTYTVVSVDTDGVVQEKETQDVYSYATGVNGERSMVVDLDSTDPDDWENDNHVLLDEVTDSRVWEVHVKDFSYDSASGVSEANRGKFLAFTEEGTTLNGEGEISTCIDYLKELGITTVQINPFYDFQTVNEAGSDSQFNWGYDPMNYNVPEGSYSTNPYDGNVRITECKKMIQALHNAGISVVMDVVYNHTYSTNSCFENTVPDYYYRMKADGTFSNGSGCGNECATERAMYRDYVIQSLLYWVNEYHVDGFRFDLMGIMDVETMNLIREALDSVDTRITTWGEGWAGGSSAFPEKTCTGADFLAAVQGNAFKMDARIAFFNDGIRDGIKGNCMNISNTGFAQGDKTGAKDVRYGVRANSKGSARWKAQAPSQCVTYAACHDNATLYDQILGSTKLANYGERDNTAVQINKLAAAIVFASQGSTFILAGEEMCRSKDGDTNSYKSAATLNMIKWQNVVDYADVISYYKGLMKIRSVFAPLTCADKTYENNFGFKNSTTALTNDIVYTIKNDQENEWQNMAVLFNSAKTEQTLTLRDKTVTDWVIIANDQEAGFENLGEVTGSTFTVPARSAIIAVDKASFDALNLSTDMGKVVVNYVYENSGSQLDSSVVLQGSVGTGYATSPSAAVADTYVVSKVEGNTVGKFSDEVEEVTYYYTDYVPESIQNADFNNDGEVSVVDVTTFQRYLAKYTLESLNGKTEAEILTLFDLNYDGEANVNDITMLQRYLANTPVSTGTVVANYYYTDENGEVKKMFSSVTTTGRVGSDYTTKAYKVVGYAVDPEKYPETANGKIPYGSVLNVDYYYIASSLDITLHIKHNGDLDWAPTLWIWGSNLNGVDSDNYTTSQAWPGDTITEKDENGWYLNEFTYKGSGSYNIIVSNSGETQTVDYKGFVDNELWVVIDDSKVSGGTYLTFYTENPDVNPDAPIADQI